MKYLISFINLKRVVLTLFISAIVCIQGCSSTPATRKHEIEVSHELDPPKVIVEANVGIYFEPQISSYIHKQAFSDDIAAIHVGHESASLFSDAVPLAFKKAQVIDKMPPYDIEKTELDGIIEPRLDYVNWRTGFQSADDYFHVEYTFILYTSDGVPLSIWRIRGEGKYLQDQMTDAAQKFVTGFSTAPETERFRKYLASKMVGNLKFNTDHIDVKAEIIDENTLGLELIASGILPVKVAVSNNTGHQVMGRGYDARLIYSNNRRIPPAFPLAVISATEYLAALGASDPAVAAAFFTPLAVIPIMSGQSSDQQDVRKNQVKYFEEARLKEVTLANGDTIQGKLYFTLPEDINELENADLSIWFIDPSVANGKRKVVNISGINYKKLTPEEMKVKAKEMQKRLEEMESADIDSKTEDEFE